MGLEDYRVVLKSKPRKAIFPDEREGTSKTSGGAQAPRRVTAAEVAAVLETMGFARQSQAIQVGPARLAAPAGTETRFMASHEVAGTAEASSVHGVYIVEALVRGRDDSRGGGLLFDSLSMRFAVCQPEGAAWHFLKLVKRLCDKLSLVVVHGERTYSPEVFWAFRLRANEQIRSQQALWREIFEDDGERIPLAVEDAWGHFLRKHPGLIRSGARATVPHAPVRSGCADADMEETLPPKAAKVVPVRRGAQS